MKFPSVLMVAGLSACMSIAAAAPDPAAGPGSQAVEKSLEQLIQDLSSEQFRTREEASRRIWEMGDTALSALQAIATGKDPEQAYRARELIRKIQLHITPDTDPAIIGLVERYEKASGDEKVNLFSQLNKRRAWRQILKLYASEANPELQLRLQQALRRGVAGGEGVTGVAVTAARECLLEGDPAAAREFLEMAPADASGLLALADFHRSQGTLEAELKRARTLKGVNADAWQLALHRAAGNLEAARDSATAAGETKLSAAMSALLGDPLPWMRGNQAGQGGEIYQPYVDLAIRRWQGKPVRPLDLYPIELALKSRNRPDRHNAINALFLLGESALAEAAYVKTHPLEAFAYFESQERISDALKALGFDPDEPNYTGWVAKRMENLAKDGDGEDEEQHLAMDGQELVMMANFLERRGLRRQWTEAFHGPLAELAEKSEATFVEILAMLFGGAGSTQTAPEVAKEAAVAWAGEDVGRWQDVVTAAFGGEDEMTDVWEWMAELDPKANRVERFKGLLALCGRGRDPAGLRARWLNLAWKAVGQAPADKRQPLMMRMMFLSAQSPDVANSLRIWDQLAETGRAEASWRNNILDLSAAGRWEEAADFFRKQIERIEALKLDPQPALYACAAASLRKAGRDADADAQDAWVEKLALGRDAAEIANGYAFGQDYTRASEWWARAARQCDPTDLEAFSIMLQLHSTMLIEQGKWKEVASVSEVRAQMAAGADSGSESPLTGLRLRLQADLGRALGNLKADRAGSIAMLEKCQAMFPCDGSLADDFFPALRQVGLIKEHDQWFKESWDRILAVVDAYPESDNTANTAGWLASRAQRNLNQAQKLLERALTLNPDQPPYLDTMAEIQFAKGNREKALEWSTRAVNFKPLDSMIRRQQERFRSAPLPR